MSLNGAVFLSYASGEAAAAERITTSLRAAGIEVWSDRPFLLPARLFLNERAEHCGPLAFEVSVQLETLLKQSFDSLQRLRPG